MIPQRKTVKKKTMAAITAAMTERTAMLTPLLKYPGGKTKELKYIMPALPRSIKNYYEPFIGGGAVYFSVASDSLQNVQHYYINDRSDDLMLLYRAVGQQDPDFHAAVERIDRAWIGAGEYTALHMDELVLLFRNGIEDEESAKARVNAWVDDHRRQMTESFTPEYEDAQVFFGDLAKSIVRKITFLRKQTDKGTVISRDDFEGIITTAFKSSIYVYYRDLFNRMYDLNFSDGRKAALYLFIRQYAYSSMFRYSKTGKFNVPYGGMSYNNNTLESRFEYFNDEKLHQLLTNTTMGNEDFEQFMYEHQPEAGDFIFLDPPYDTDFSTYANNEFGQSEQERLAQYLINESVANWMLVIKNTELISSLYPADQETANGQKIYLNAFDKSYLVNFKNRNDKDVEHLLITNYEVPNQKFI